jgi:hypothetical protein
MFDSMLTYANVDIITMSMFVLNRSRIQGQMQTQRQSKRCAYANLRYVVHCSSRLQGISIWTNSDVCEWRCKHCAVYTA